MSSSPLVLKQATGWFASGSSTTRHLAWLRAQVRSACSMAKPPITITSLRYFCRLIEEVGEAEVSTSYWNYVRSKADQLERQWLCRYNGEAAALT